MGAMGMSVGDFCMMTPEEFALTSKCYRETTEATQRDAWERMRLLAAICIQPHVKRKLQPKQLIPLPWDKEAKEHPKLPIPTKEERMAALIRRLGNAKG